MFLVGPALFGALSFKTRYLHKVTDQLQAWAADIELQEAVALGA